jgi:hypothetical protein
VLRFHGPATRRFNRDINEKKQITDETDKKLRDALKAFNLTWQ